MRRYMPSRKPPQVCLPPQQSQQPYVPYVKVPTPPNYAFFMREREEIYQRFLRDRAEIEAREAAEAAARAAARKEAEAQAEASRKEALQQAQQSSAAPCCDASKPSESAQTVAAKTNENGGATSPSEAACSEAAQPESAAKEKKSASSSERSSALPLKAADSSPSPSRAMKNPKRKTRRKRIRVSPCARPSRRAARPRAPRGPLSSLERHARKCQICRHPYREDLEADYVNWCSARWIRTTYQLNDQSTLYRHARITGLLERRRENLRGVAEIILEQVHHIETPSAFAILRAVRTLACLNERGQWTEPPTTHVTISATQPPSLAANPSTETSNQASTPELSPSSAISSEVRALPSASQAVPQLPAATGAAISNRQTPELEMSVSCSKERPEVVSNRQT